MSAAPSSNERFQEAIIVGCTPNRAANSAVVISFVNAASATLALNSGLYFFRFLPIVRSFLFGVTQSLAHCPTFGDLRRESINDLESAENLKPKDFVIWQNLGLIFLDRRFDPEGINLNNAKRYFVKSQQLKPKDWWAYRQLGTVHMRRAELEGVNKEAKDEIEEGWNYMLEAYNRRKHPTVLILKSKLATMRWVVESNGEERKKRANEIKESLLSLEEVQEEDPQACWAKVVWHAAQLAYGDVDFAETKKSILEICEECLKAAGKHGDIDWFADQVKQATEQISNRVKALEESDRGNLRFRFDGSPIK